MKLVGLYIAAIVGVNYGFVHVPLVDLGPLGMWPPMSLLVGFVFILRDYAQRSVGHWVIPGMAAGAVLSYILASPFVAVASATAFAISELINWAVYTTSKKRTFVHRADSEQMQAAQMFDDMVIVLSSVISTPLDSAVFLIMIGHFSWIGWALMSISKMVGLAVVVSLEKRT